MESVAFAKIKDKTTRQLYQEVLSLVLEYKPKDVLDLGSGSGDLVGEINKKGFQVVATDIDIKRFKLKKIPCIKIDLNEDLNINRKFDMIVCTEVIEHVENPSKLIREMYALLKKNGIAIISTPNNENWFSRLFFLITGKFPYFRGDKTYFFNGIEYGFPHIHPIYTWQMKQIIDELFKIEKIEFNRSYIPVFGFNIPIKNTFFGQISIFVLRKK